MSNLISHSGSKKVTYNDLVNLPVPEVLGPRHKPVAHKDLIDQLKLELAATGFTVSREEYAVQRKQGALLFGVMDLESTKLTDLKSSELRHEDNRGLSLGFRHSNDMEFGLRMVAGARVFVCDNLVLRGDMIVLKRKHTKNLQLVIEIQEAVAKLVDDYKVLDQEIVALQEHEIATDEAKSIMYDAFIKHRVLPMRYMEKVDQWYFNPPDQATDCQPRTAWALHNAFTRTIKELPSPARQFEVTVGLGKVFGLTK